MTPKYAGGLVICSSSWSRGDELSFVIRAVAGAASRLGPITVFIPGSGDTIPDGGFDLIPVGQSADGIWPDASKLRLPEDFLASTCILMDEFGPNADAVLKAFGSSGQVFTLTSGPDAATVLRLVGDEEGSSPLIGMHVPINPLASAHRHNGFGFVDYVLVLSGRSGSHELPPDEVAWLTAGLHHADIVVVENAVASVWRGRALRGSTTIDTRTDLGRLMAHALVCVDLAPGPYVGRECVELLRYGTPIVVPEGTAAASHARMGGLTYDHEGELVQKVTRFEDASFRHKKSLAGRHYADATYGDTTVFTQRLSQALASTANG